MSENMFPEKLDRKIIYESDWISLYADKVKMPDGSIIDSYHRLHHPNEAVCVVVVNDNDEILLIQSKRYVTNRIEWEIPAGGVEKNETAEKAAQRECLEETGCTIKDLKYLCCQNPSNGMSDLVIHTFAARVGSESMEFDENEVYGKQWMKKEQVLEMLKKNEIHCGVSMLALLYMNQFYL